MRQQEIEDKLLEEYNSIMFDNPNYVMKSKNNRNIYQYLKIKLLRYTAIFLFISFMFNFYVSGQIKIKTDLEEYNLKGRVKKIEKNYYTTKMYFGEITKDEPTRPDDPNIFDSFRELHFNEYGNVIKNIYKDKNGSPDGYAIYTYDKYNRIIKMINNENNTITWSYNDIDFTSKKHFPKGTSGEEISYYDKNSNLIKLEVYTNGELIFRRICEYNNKGELISEKEYGGPLAKQEGELTSQKSYQYAGILKFIHEVNKYGTDDYKNTFNKYGDVIDITELKDFGSSFCYEYKYDKNNNWIERIEYFQYPKNKTPHIMTIRKIEYY